MLPRRRVRGARVSGNSLPNEPVRPAPTYSFIDGDQRRFRQSAQLPRGRRRGCRLAPQEILAEPMVWPSRCGFAWRRERGRRNLRWRETTFSLWICAVTKTPQCGRQLTLRLRVHAAPLLIEPLTPSFHIAGRLGSHQQQHDGRLRFRRRNLRVGGLALAHSTVSDNSTEGYHADGGGIWAADEVIVASSTVSGNSVASAIGQGWWNLQPCRWILVYVPLHNSGNTAGGGVEEFRAMEAYS